MIDHRLKPMPPTMRAAFLRANGIDHPHELRRRDLVTRADFDYHLEHLSQIYRVRMSWDIPSRGLVVVSITQSWWGRLFRRGQRASVAFLRLAARAGSAVVEHSTKVETRGLFVARPR